LCSIVSLFSSGLCRSRLLRHVSLCVWPAFPSFFF
jgi:hypothetical protein